MSQHSTVQYPSRKGAFIPLSACVDCEGWETFSQTNYPINCGLAYVFGLGESMILTVIHSWVMKKKLWLERNPHANDHTFRDGRIWTYHTYKEFHEEIPYLCERTIARYIRKLEESGVLLSSSKYNRKKYDRTKWYAIDYQALNRAIQEKIHGYIQSEPFTLPIMEPVFQYGHTHEENVEENKEKPTRENIEEKSINESVEEKENHSLVEEKSHDKVASGTKEGKRRKRARKTRRAKKKATIQSSSKHDDKLSAPIPRNKPQDIKPLNKEDLTSSLPPSLSGNKRLTKWITSLPTEEEQNKVIHALSVVSTASIMRTSEVVAFVRLLVREGCLDFSIAQLKTAIQRFMDATTKTVIYKPSVYFYNGLQLVLNGSYTRMVSSRYRELNPHTQPRTRRDVPTNVPTFDWSAY